MIKTEGTYTCSTIDGDEVYSVGLEAGMYDASAGKSIGIKDNAVSGSKDVKGVDLKISGNANILNHMEQTAMKKANEGKGGDSSAIGGGSAGGRSTGTSGGGR